MTKTTVSAPSSTLSAISLGVRCRSEPSTSAIIRSTKDWPGSEVIRTTIRSESTTVAAGHRAAVTARLPDDGRGLAGHRGLVDRGDALDHVTVARDALPRHDHDDVAGPQHRARDLVGRQLGQVGGVAQLVEAAADLAGRASRSAGRAGWRPGPCRGPRRPTPPASRTGRSARARPSRASPASRGRRPRGRSWRSRRSRRRASPACRPARGGRACGTRPGARPAAGGG